MHDIVIVKWYHRRRNKLFDDIIVLYNYVYNSVYATIMKQWLIFNFYCVFVLSALEYSYFILSILKFDINIYIYMGLESKFNNVILIEKCIFYITFITKKKSCYYWKHIKCIIKCNNKIFILNIRITYNCKN